MRKDEEVLTKKLLFNGIFSFSECGGLMISVCRRTEATWKKATDSKFATSCHPKGIINMKKTLTLLIAMGSFAVFSEAATVFNYYTPGTDNYNSTIHGFYLGLGSSCLAPSDSSSPSSLSGEIRLDSFTLRGAANNLGANVTYGFLVLNGSDNSVIGWSTNTGTTAAGINLTFSFSSLDGSPLLHHFLHVHERVSFAGSRVAPDC